MSKKTPPMWAIKAARELDERMEHTEFGKSVQAILGDDYFLNDAAVIAAHAPDASALALALEQAGHYLADLNGSEWIKGDDAGSLDMKQRARTQQARINKALAAYRAAHPDHSSTK